MSASYYRNQGTKKKKRLLTVVKVFVILCVLGVLGLAAVIGYDVYRQSNGETAGPESKTVTSTIASSTQIFNTPYFQFQASDKWRAIANESRDGHYVYRQYNSSLVEQEFTVDVNSPTQEIIALSQTGYVVPIIKTEEGTLKVQGTISPHCKKIVGANARNVPQTTVYQKVSFTCTPDSSLFNVVVGQVGGDTNMTLNRPSGSTGVYRISYKNLTANPTSNELLNIIETFETR